MKHIIIAVSGLAFVGHTLFFGVPKPKPATLAVHKMSLEDRYAVPSVNQVMKDNILLTLAYMRGIVPNPTNINWKAVEKPFNYSFELKPGDTYAFQKDALPQFKDSITVTTSLHFAAQEGFKSDGYLFGDGVCHLASLFYWVARDAGLTAVAPTNHNFAVIPEIPKTYGVAIFSMPGQTTTNANQNLYVRNNNTAPVKFNITYDGKNLKVNVEKVNANVDNLTALAQEIM